MHPELAGLDAHTAADRIEPILNSIIGDGDETPNAEVWSRLANAQEDADGFGLFAFAWLHSTAGPLAVDEAARAAREHASEYDFPAALGAPRAAPYRAFLTFAAELARRVDGPMYLPRSTVSAVLNVSDASVGRWRSVAIAEGYLREVEPATARRAARLEWCGPTRAPAVAQHDGETVRLGLTERPGGTGHGPEGTPRDSEVRKERENARERATPSHLAQIQIPTRIDTPAVREAIAGWFRHSREIGTKISREGWKAKLAELGSFDATEAAELILASTANGYRAIVCDRERPYQSPTAVPPAHMQRLLEMEREAHEEAEEGRRKWAEEHQR